MPTELKVTFTPKKKDSSTLHSLISIIPPQGSEARTPTDICCVIDISGSMDSPAPNPLPSSSSPDTERCNLSVLDLVKHSVKTIVACLREGDRLSIVSYSTNARVELQLTQMDEIGKNSALDVLNSLRPKGSTNIWDGLLKGMEAMSQNNSFERNSAIFLLTDGCPNIQPPKGHIPSMKDYKDSHGGVYPATISTFGFGYNLQSDLLNEIALEGGGYYAFIPDSGFVGTIFVNVSLIIYYLLLLLFNQFIQLIYLLFINSILNRLLQINFLLLQNKQLYLLNYQMELRLFQILFQQPVQEL